MACLNGRKWRRTREEIERVVSRPFNGRKPSVFHDVVKDRLSMMAEDKELELRGENLSLHVYSGSGEEIAPPIAFMEASDMTGEALGRLIGSVARSLACL